MTERLECVCCGLAAVDLPDGVDPEFVFEGGYCQGCAGRTCGCSRW